MFTGIIEEVGKITNIKPLKNGVALVIQAKKVLEDVSLGDSIAINGACQTVVSFNNNSFEVEVSAETLTVTTFKQLSLGNHVNLERALSLNARLGGHLVSGHVDGVGIVQSVISSGDFWTFTVAAPENIAKYIIYKGSICINGISLTVSDSKNNGETFSVAVIPHTISNTTLLTLKEGDLVNLESDLIAKYIEKLMVNQITTVKKPDISMDFLQKHGFA